MAYCDLSDLFAYGVSRGALRNAGRLVGSVDASANTFELDVHGFSTGTVVTFRAEAGGSLPSPLVSGASYYAIRVSESRFSVSLTSGGSVLDLTTAGSRIVVVAELPESAVRDWASRLIDDMLPAHVVPLSEPYPEIVRMTAAELSAARLLAMLGEQSTSLATIADSAQKRLERWSRGVPVRGENAPKSAVLSASVSAPANDSRGWRVYGGL